MVKLLLVILLGIHSIAFAVAPLLKNDREGKSYYIKKADESNIQKLVNSYSATAIIDMGEAVLNEFNPVNICSLDVVRKLGKSFSDFDNETILLTLRELNVIDDIALSILLKSVNLKNFKKRPTYSEKTFKNYDEEKKKNLLRLFSTFSKKVERGACSIVEYKSLYSELRNKEKKLKKSELKANLDFALNSKAITQSDYELLERFRKSKVEEWSLLLSDYIKKKNQLRVQYPTNTDDISSSFVTQKMKKTKMSYRMRLYQSYDQFQIVLMADVIKKLRRRIDSDRAEILIFPVDAQEDTEIIPLDPMERFRLAIKLLNREMNDLSINTFFENRRPSYTDLIVAAYELGIIAASEVDEVASLEEIWNPKKTFWEKAQFWVTSVLTVSAVIIPPPYGFIPTLAIVAIQASNQAKKKPEYDHSLF